MPACHIAIHITLLIWDFIKKEYLTKCAMRSFQLRTQSILIGYSILVYQFKQSFYSYTCSKLT